MMFLLIKNIYIIKHLQIYTFGAKWLFIHQLKMATNSKRKELKIQNL